MERKNDFYFIWLAENSDFCLMNEQSLRVYNPELPAAMHTLRIMKSVKVKGQLDVRAAFLRIFLNVHFLNLAIFC